jgi:gas vesicle protein
MLRRRMRKNQARRAITNRLPSTEEVRDQVAEVTDELGEALEVAKDAIAKAMTSAGRRGTEAGAEATRKTAMLGKEAGRKGMVAGKRASRRARGATLDAVGRRLPEPELVAELTRRATEKVFPERAKHYRKTVRKRRRRLMYGGAGLAAIGMLIGWLTAPKKGDETRQVLKERANAASDKVAELRATAGPQRPADTSTTSGMVADSGVGSGSMAGSGTGAGMPATGADTGAQDQQGAEVTPIHQADDATATKRR